MAGQRPSTRGGRPRSSSRPGTRPSRGGGSRPRTLAATRPPGGSSRNGPPPRPRFTGRAAILVLVVAVLMVSYASSMRAYLEQRHLLQSLHTEITQSRQEIETLQREKQRWDDPAYVRAQARQRFGWVLPGETAFQVIGRDGEPLDHDDSLSEPVVEEQRDHPLWWQAAWRSVEVAGNPEEAADEPQPATRIKAPKPPDSSGSSR